MDTTGVITAHSELKLKVLDYYVRTLVKIVSGFTDEIHFIDAFCGKGEDENGKEGSAKILINLLNEVSKTNQKVKFKISFNDKNTEHTKCIEKFASEVPHQNINIEITNKDGEEFLNDLNLKSSLKNFKFLFYDPYNYSPIKKQLIFDFLNKNKSEALIFLPFSHIYRFVNGVKNGKYKEDHILSMFLSDIFGEDYKDVDNSSENIFFRNLLEQFRSSNLLCSHLLIQDGSNKYGLLYFSGSTKGSRVFLDACFRKFDLASDLITDYDYDHSVLTLKIRSKEDFGQMGLFDNVSDCEDNFLITDEIFFSSLKGKVLSNIELFNYILDKNVLPKHCTGLLKRLEKSDTITVSRPEKTRVGSFFLDSNPKKSIKITFN